MFGSLPNDTTAGGSRIAAARPSRARALSGFHVESAFRGPGPPFTPDDHAQAVGGREPVGRIPLASAEHELVGPGRIRPEQAGGVVVGLVDLRSAVADVRGPEGTNETGEPGPVEVERCARGALGERGDVDTEGDELPVHGAGDPAVARVE